MEKDISADDAVIIKRSDPITACKSMGSFVKIDSISIDLDDGNDDNSNVGKCDHFSIRGYVSEIRKKNWKICWPFSSDGDMDKSDQEKLATLPPLDAPKFRSWCCQNCLREIGSKNVANSRSAVLNRHIGSDSKLTGFRMPRKTAIALLQSQKGPKSKRRFHGYTNASVDDRKTHRISKKKSISQSQKSNFTNSTSLVPRYSSAVTEVNIGKKQERHNNVTEKLGYNGSARVSKPGFESHKDDSFELETTKNNSWIRHCNQNGETEYHSFAGDKQTDSNYGNGLCKAGKIGQTGNPIKVQTNPLILDECDYASSENPEKSSGSHRKKNRKVRLLTELLCETDDPKTGNSRKEDSPINRINITSEVESASQGQVSLQENVRLGSSEIKKRKLPEGEEKGVQETSHPKVLSKKVRSVRRDVEAVNAVIGAGVDEDNASTRMSLQADMKNSWSRNGIERINTVGKKKFKKSHDFDARPSLAPTAEKLPVEAPKRSKNASKNATNDASFRLTYDPSTVRGTELHSSKRDRKSGLVKIKGKLPESDAGQASVSYTRKYAQTKPNGQGTVPFHPVIPVEDASNQNGLDLSLNRYLASQRYDQSSLSQQRDGFPSLSTWKDSTCKLDEFMRKNVEVSYLANLNKPSSSMANQSSEDGIHGEPSNKVYTYNMPIVNKETNYSYHVEQGSASLMQQMDVPRRRKTQKIIDAEKYSGVPVSKKHINHQSEVSEKGTIDDIPMEIVELMAKNQYERCLQETQNDKRVSETPITGRNPQTMVYNQVYGLGDLRVSEGPSQKRKAQAKSTKSGTTMKTLAPVQPKPVDYFSYINGNHLALNRPDQMHCTTGFGPFSQSQKKPSLLGQFPTAGNSQCSCAQSCKWDGNMMGHGFVNSNLQSFAACSTCHSYPQSKGDAVHLWSPLASLPFAYKNPRKGAAPSSDFKMLPPSTSTLQKGNADGDCDLSLNLNARNFEKRNEAVGSETISRKNPENSFIRRSNVIEPNGSSDVYSNETIPAMHLLSLNRSGASLDMGGNPKFPKRPSSNALNSKAGLDIGLFKATDTVNHPSSNCYGNNHLSEKFLDLFPTKPTFAASTSSFEHSKGFGRDLDFTAQAANSQKKENIQISHRPPQNRGPRLDKSLVAEVGFGYDRAAIPVHSVPKGFFPVSSPTMFPLQFHSIANSRKHNLETPIANGTMRPPVTSLESAICCINRNPADFSMPDVGSGYMIRGEDLKVGKKIPSGKWLGLYKVAQQKRQGNAKQIVESNMRGDEFHEQSS